MTTARTNGVWRLGLGMLAAFAFAGGGAAWAQGAAAANSGSAAGQPAGATHGEGAQAGLSLPPAQLVEALHQVNKLEIDAGKLAQSRGTGTVKTYGEQLEADHKLADKAITSYARENDIALNQVPAPLQAQEQQMRATLNQLRTLQGTNFDRQFAETMVKAHTKALSMVDASRSNVTDPQLQGVLGVLEPTLRAHRQIAENILQGMGNQASRAAPATGAMRQGRRGATER
jgi:putative membrane protein